MSPVDCMTASHPAWRPVSNSLLGPAKHFIILLHFSCNALAAPAHQDSRLSQSFGFAESATSLQSCPVSPRGLSTVIQTPSAFKPLALLVLLFSTTPAGLPIRLRDYSIPCGAALHSMDRTRVFLHTKPNCWVPYAADCPNLMNDSTAGGKANNSTTVNLTASSTATPP